MNTTTITGKVARANGKGLVLEGEQDWRNISKYASPTPTIPQRGQLVTLTVDGQGFIRSIDPAPAPAPAEAPAEKAPETPAPDRERCISRMAVLNTAVAILSSGAREADPAEVLALAARLEAWVYRN